MGFSRWGFKMIKIYLKFVGSVKDIRFKFIPLHSKGFIELEGGLKNAD